MNNGDDMQESFITSASQLREILGPVSDRARTKARSELSDIDISWLEASPFCLIATSANSGSCDVSPKGDPCGFTHVINSKTLVIPERLGNRRADSFHNILENGHVGMIYFVPGRGDTLRINGRAQLIRNATYFDNLVVNGHRPSIALRVDIKEIYFHCSKAFLRSGLWDSATWKPDSVPSRARISKALENTPGSLEELEAYYCEQYKQSLYSQSR